LSWVLDDLWLSTLALHRRFPEGRDPFKMIARLAEECGELAAEVQHWEAQGIKRQKHGDPDPARTAKEVMDVMRAALAVAHHYGLREVVEDTISGSVRYAVSDGQLTADEAAGRVVPTEFQT